MVLSKALPKLSWKMYAPLIFHKHRFSGQQTGRAGRGSGERVEMVCTYMKTENG